MSLNKQISLDEIWATVAKPFRDILTNVQHGLTSPKYMELYT